MEEEVKGIGDYLDVIWRRKFWVIIPAILFSVLTAIVVMLLPATYLSQGTILIESQEIPKSLVQSTVTSYADQRVQVIKQRLMTTQKIMEVVDKYHLYAKERQETPSPSIITELFKSNVRVKLVQADVTDPVSGRAKKSEHRFHCCIYG
jgi:uncharacterized protein involved in exopolysaccharide biosynthesis